MDTVPDCPHLYDEYYRNTREISLWVPSRRAEIRSISRKPWNPRCRRYTGDQQHPGMQESRVSLGTYHLGEQRSGRSLGSSRNPRCQRDAGIYKGKARTQAPGSAQTQAPGSAQTQAPGKARTQTLGKAQMQSPARTQAPGKVGMQTPGKAWMQSYTYSRGPRYSGYPRNIEIHPMDTEVSIEDQEIRRDQETRRPRNSETWQFRDQNSKKSEEAESSEEPWDPG